MTKDQTDPRPDGPAAEPLALRLNDQLGAGPAEARCMCNDRALSACPGQWEPGCDLGNNPAHVRRSKREHPVCMLTAAELNHLRRLLGWVRCEVGQPPDEMVPMVRSIVRQLGDVSAEGKARLVEAHAEANNVPQYVRAALKALGKTLEANPECLPEAEDVGAPVLPAPNAALTGRQRVRPESTEHEPD